MLVIQKATPVGGAAPQGPARAWTQLMGAWLDSLEPAKELRRRQGMEGDDGASATMARHRQIETPVAQELQRFAAEQDAPTPTAQPQAPSLQGEYANICLLLVLYTLQGVPMGLSAVLPLVLRERGASFADVGFFSLNSWPFALKLCWAPIVDAVYIPSIGRRKTWMAPAQVLIGTVMIVLSFNLDQLLYVDKPNILALTSLFFVLYFLCATQDIAVDGWALTMLRKENVAYAATCNSVGQTAGYAFGYTGYMVLEQYKLATLSSFMTVIGVLFLVVTTVVVIMKTEKPVPPEEEPEDVLTAYRQMGSMLTLRPMRQMILVLFTWKMGFAVADGVAPLKFQEYGVPKEHLAYLSTVLMPAYIALPVVISRWTVGSTPLDVAMKAYPSRIASGIALAALAYCTPAQMSPVPWVFYLVLVLLTGAAAFAAQCMFVAQMSFFARVSDPAMGGTYMTLLNTLGNLGGMWPPTVTMFLIDATTCKGKTCMLEVDGFYVMAFAGAVIAFIWFCMMANRVRALQHIKLDDWKVTATCAKLDRLDMQV